MNLNRDASTSLTPSETVDKEIKHRHTERIAEPISTAGKTKYETSKQGNADIRQGSTTDEGMAQILKEQSIEQWTTDYNNDEPKEQRHSSNVH